MKEPHFGSSCYFEVLGLSPDASETDISKAYRRLALKYHPDKNDSDEAEYSFNRIKEAYDCLRDDEARRLYKLPSVEHVTCRLSCITPSGTVVALRGLSKSPELNGKRGIIVGVDWSSNQYEIQIDSDSMRMLVDSGNLGRLSDAPALPNGTPVIVHGLQRRPEHNNKCGIIVGVELQKGQYEVELGDGSPKLLVKPDNLLRAEDVSNVFPNGTAVVVQGLLQTPEHNGKSGVVTGLDEFTGNCMVRLDREPLVLGICPDFLESLAGLVATPLRLGRTRLRTCSAELVSDRKTIRVHTTVRKSTW